MVRAGLGGVACAHLNAVPPSPWHLGQRSPAKFDVKAMRWEAINAVGLGTRPVPSNAPERVETQQRQSLPKSRNVTRNGRITTERVRSLVTLNTVYPAHRAVLWGSRGTSARCCLKPVDDKNLKKSGCNAFFTGAALALRSAPPGRPGRHGATTGRPAGPGNQKSPRYDHPAALTGFGGAPNL